MRVLLVACALFSSNVGYAAFEKKADRPVPALNSVSEVSLRTAYSNESDVSISDKTSLFLSDYDKKNKLPILEATGEQKGKDQLPYILEKCEGGSCGVAEVPTGTALDKVTLATAKEALKKKAAAKSIDKAKFKDGTVWIVHSEAPDKTSGKKWAVTVAVELQKFVPNAKNVNVKYKVLEFAQK